jgi:hypothetical protein
MMSLPRFRASVVFVVVIGGLSFLPGGWAASEETKMISASKLVQMIGVNVHMRYSDGAYANSLNVLQGLKYLGIAHIRDQMPGTASQADMQARDGLRRMAFGGIKLDLIYPSGWEPSLATELLRNLEKAVPGSVAFVEGYNEINNFPVVYEGLSGAEGAAAGQRALYRAIKQDPDLKGVRVIDMTGFEEIKSPIFSYGSSLEGYADVMNVHAYAQNGAQPGIWINPERIGAYKSIEQWLPKIITEFGYASIPQSGWLVIGVDERTQAKGLLNGLFDAARSGYDKVYIYELLDEKPDPEAKELQFHFGLFAFDNRPKIAAQAIKNLIRIFGLPESEVKVFERDRADSHETSLSPSPIQLTVQRSDTQDRVYTLGVAKSNGDTFAAVWRETSFWDRANGQPLDTPGVRASLGFGKPCGSTRLYDILQSSAPISVSNENPFPLMVRDHVQLVECVNQ